MAIYRTDKEIDSLYESSWMENNKTNFPNKSYEDGIIQTLDWLTTKQYEHPLNNNNHGKKD